MNPSEFPGNLTSSCRSTRWGLRIGCAGLLAFLAVICGCLSRPPLPRQTYAFSVPLSSATNAVSNDRVLGLKILRISPPFDGRALTYRTGEFSYARDPYAEFLSPPAEGLVAPVCAILQKAGGFRAAVEAGGVVKPDTLVEIRIDQLYGDVRKRESPYAVLAMRVTFLSALNGLPGNVILQRNYSRRIPMRSATAAALMAGWNEALVGILTDAASDFQRADRETRNPAPDANTFTQK